jgi:hypothetical protein
LTTSACLKNSTTPISKESNSMPFLWKRRLMNPQHLDMPTTSVKRASKERLSRILTAVATSVGERMAPLKQVEKYKNSGIEAWFKVEVFHALKDTDPVLRPQNKGPDLALNDGLEIELKGATDFNIKGWFVPGLKYGTPCLFLGWTEVPSKHVRELTVSSQFETVGITCLCNSGWHVGMIVPNGYFTAC